MTVYGRWPEARLSRGALCLLGVAGLVVAACRAPEDAFTERVAKRLREQHPGVDVTVKDRFHIQVRERTAVQRDVSRQSLA